MHNFVWKIRRMPSTLGCVFELKMNVCADFDTCFELRLNSCTSQPDVWQHLVVHRPMDNMSNTLQYRH